MGVEFLAAGRFAMRPPGACFPRRVSMHACKKLRKLPAAALPHHI